MRWPRVQFTIRGLMGAIALVAFLLALHPVLALTLIVLSIPWLVGCGTRWLVLRGKWKLAGYSFWLVAVLTNIVAAIYCISPTWRSYTIAFSVVLFVGVPSLAALGKAWVGLLSREKAVPARARATAGYSVLVMALLPIVTFWTLWPLRLAFLAARPSMEKLADQATDGASGGFRVPRHVGLFRVVADEVYPRRNGYVGLIVDQKLRTGFVRVHPGTTRNSRGPIIGLNLDVYLGGGWWYRG